jgi:hypothetical protein
MLTRQRMAAALPYALLGSGGLSAASLGVIQAGNAMDGEDQMTGSDKLQLVLAALGGLAMGGAHGLGRGRRLIVEKDPDGGMRVSVPEVELKQKAEEAVTQRAAADAAEVAAKAGDYDQGAVNRAYLEKMARLQALEDQGIPDPWGAA